MHNLIRVLGVGVLWFNLSVTNFWIFLWLVLFMTKYDDEYKTRETDKN